MLVDSILISSSNWTQLPPSMLRTVEVVVVVEAVMEKEMDEEADEEVDQEMDEEADYEVEQEVEQPPFTLNSCSGLWVMRRRWA